jgi:predicted nucleic acid-binding protein
MYLLDTNVVSELRKATSGRANKNVVQWASNEDTETLFISVITVLELEMGILSMERRDQQQGLMLRRWLEDQVLPSFEGRILPIDIAIARKCAELHVPDKRAERDAMIAATAVIHRMRVVTRNVADFGIAGVEVINPWLSSL